MTNYVEKARRIELFESGEAYVEVTLSNHILPTNSNNQRVTLTRSTGTFVAGTHNTDHSAYNGLVRASELEIHWDDGSVSSHKGHFNRTSDSQGYFEWGKAHGLLDANNLPGKAYLKTVKITNASFYKCFNRDNCNRKYI